MKTKRNYKQEIKDWWVENKKVIEAGVVCGLFGVGYGFVKGLSSYEKLWMSLLNKAAASGESSGTTN